MTSSTEDCLNFDLIDEKALETLIIVPIRVLKRGNKKWAGKRFQNWWSIPCATKFVKAFLTKHWIV